MGCNCKNQGWRAPPESNFPDAPEPSQYQRRLFLCAGCADLQRFHAGVPPGADVGLLDRCGACGCFVRAKALLAGQSCPQGKW